jgi:O-antigen/teichoic acid export membrane protein/SAM-dependent methyltransferase
VNSTSSALPSRLPSALRNVLSNWAGFVCSSLIAFFLSPFLVRHLGVSGYGVWVLVGSLTGYLSLLNLGVRAAVTRYVAKLHAEANHREASALASTAMAIFLAAGVCAILISASIAAFVVPVFQIPETYRFAARIVIVLAGFNIGASLIGGVFGGIVAALHRFDLINLVDVGTAVLSALATIVLLSNGNGLVALAMLNFALAIVVGITYARMTFHLYPALTIRFSDCDLRRLTTILSFSIYAFVLQVSYNLIFYTDSIVISAILPVSFVAMFAIGGNLIAYTRMLISGISTTMTPRASTLDATGGEREVAELLLRATNVATLVMLPIAVTFWIRGTSFIRLWMGETYAEPSGRVLRILTLALVFIAADQVVTSTVLGIGKQKWLVVAVCGEAFCNLALSIALVRPLGISGVAWGTTLPSLALSIGFIPWFVRHSMGIPIRTYLVSAWFRPVAAVVFFSLLTYAMETRWPATTLLVFFLQTAAILPAVLIGSWHSCLDRSQRKVCTQRLLQPALKALWMGLNASYRQHSEGADRLASFDLGSYRASEAEKARTADLLRILPRSRRSVLDIGARDGHFSRLLSERFPEVTALDLREPRLDIPRVKTVAGDVSNLAFADEAFDCVFCAEVLEHVPDVERACREIVRVARREIVIGAPFKQDIRLWRTTCATCGKVNPPWGHINSFDERRLLNLFPNVRLVSKSFVGVTNEATNFLSASLMDLASNPWGAYDQEEPCIFCGARLITPQRRHPWHRACSATALRINQIQSIFTRPHGNWIHLVFSKEAN